MSDVHATEYTLTQSEQDYIKGIEGYRRFAMLIPPLSISLATSLLAFEIYYLNHFYIPTPGFRTEDIIVILPMVSGCFFLICASFAIDWVMDSFSSAELRALNIMHQNNEGKIFSAVNRKFNGILERFVLFSGAYFVFVLCISILFFLLLASLPIFVKNDIARELTRQIIFVGATYFSSLIFVKLMTISIPRSVWAVLVTLAFGLFAGVAWAILTITRII